MKRTENDFLENTATIINALPDELLPKEVTVCANFPVDKLMWEFFASSDVAVLIGLILKDSSWSMYNFVSSKNQPTICKGTVIEPLKIINILKMYKIAPTLNFN